MVEKWNHVEPNSYVTDILIINTKDYLNIIRYYNNYMILGQTYNIIKTLHLIKSNTSEFKSLR